MCDYDNIALQYIQYSAIRKYMYTRETNIVVVMGIGK